MNQGAKRWTRHHLEDRETIVTILGKEPFVDVGWQAICQARQDLEQVIDSHSIFLTSHRPIHMEEDLPEVAQRMIKASARIGVGPMAAVAGTLAWLGVEAMREAGAAEAIVDNGGDIAFWIQEPVTVGIFAGDHFKSLALAVQPRKTIFGICTSSGTIGPSFSYGSSDAAIVVSEDVALADAAATALGNQVKNQKELAGVFDFMQPIQAIEGAAVVAGENLALWGQLPEIVKSAVDPDLITKGCLG